MENLIKELICSLNEVNESFERFVMLKHESSLNAELLKHKASLILPLIEKITKRACELEDDVLRGIYLNFSSLVIGITNDYVNMLEEDDVEFLETQFDLHSSIIMQFEDELKEYENSLNKEE